MRNLTKNASVVMAVMLSLMIAFSLCAVTLHDMSRLTASADSLTSESEIYSGLTNVTDTLLNEQNTADLLGNVNAEIDPLAGVRRYIIELNGSSLIDSYNSDVLGGLTTDSLHGYLNGSRAVDLGKSLARTQDAFLQDLSRNGIVYSVNHVYTSLLNGVSIEVDSLDIAKISRISGVKSIIASETYAVPQVEVTNVVNVYGTGIYDASNISYKGDGMVVAVLDTGLDHKHNAFSEMPAVTSLTKKMVEERLDNTVAKTSFTSSLTVDSVYYNSKVPFAYDYADKDANVFPSNSSHGTHVAGIIAGKDDNPTAPRENSAIFSNGEKFTGVAPNAQLAIFKVFSDYKEGGETDDILAAVSDAVTIGADVINMSLGSSAGFSRESDAEAINAVYDKVRSAGISLIVAAANNGTSASGSPYGSNLTEHPDNGTVGSPSTYSASMSVASISGVKSPYILANGNQAVYISEGRNFAGVEFNFVDEMLGNEQSKEFKYVTIGGYGDSINYTNKIKAQLAEGNTIALVRRGAGITFEDKQKTAASFGAVGCLIYNNVSGTLGMSLGTGKVIPTALINMDEGNIMASRESGTLLLSRQQFAGPFMSDFSSWGPTPDLKLKPEITAHGGNITSAVVGGYGQYSGTSMASPNMAGAVTLLRQHVTENYPQLNAVERNAFVYKLLMSTATIANNERGISYSPRLQGAGLADIYNAINTDAYIYVDGSDKTKLELGHDPERSGVYNLVFNVENMSDKAKTFTVKPIVLTETVSSDGITVANTPYELNAGFSVSSSSASVLGRKIVVDANTTSQVTVNVVLSASDRAYLDANFKNGMYVEGFVQLIPDSSAFVSLSIPYLAFYGDWTDAPLFDVSVFDVSADLLNDSIADEDKRIALTYAGQPIGRYYRGTDYIMYLGEYALRHPEDGSFKQVPVTQEKVAIGGGDYGVYALYGLYAGMFRGAKAVEIVIYNIDTGEVVYQDIASNARKSYGNSSRGAYASLIECEIDPYALGMTNNSRYRAEFVGSLDFDGGERVENNTFAFDFYVDYEAPTVVDYSLRSEYDKDNNRRVYLDLQLYDNNVVQGMQVFAMASSSSYYVLTEYPIALYGGRNTIYNYSMEITSYLDCFASAYYKDVIGIHLIDYAFNQSFWTLPINYTQIDKLVAKDASGEEITSISMTVGSTFDLAFDAFVAVPDTKPVEYEAVSFETVDIGYSLPSAYSNYLYAYENKLYANRVGSFNLTIYPKSNSSVTIVIPVTITASTGEEEKVSVVTANISHYIVPLSSSMSMPHGIVNKNVSLPNGYEVELWLELDPWYAEPGSITWQSSNTKIATIDQNGILKTLSSGVTYITATVENPNGVLPGYSPESAYITANIAVYVQEEYTVMAGYLYEYNGPGYSVGEDGVLVIPANLGILYVGHYSEGQAGPFYGLRNLKKVIIPEGVLSIGYATFYGSSVEEIYLPSTLESIGSRAFDSCPNLKKVYWLKDVEYNDVTKQYQSFVEGVNYTAQCTALKLTIHSEAFYGGYTGNSSLEQFDFSRVTSMYGSAFLGASSLKGLNGVVDLTNLRYAGSLVFAYCNSITNVVFGKDTVVGESMFYLSMGLVEVDYYASYVPYRAFYGNEKLTSITFHNPMNYVGSLAFEGCTKLQNVNFVGRVAEIRQSAFRKCNSLVSVTLPQGLDSIGAYAFLDCISLIRVIIPRNATLGSIGNSVFYGCNNLTTLELSGASALFVNEAITHNGKSYTYLRTRTVDNTTKIVLLPPALDLNIEDLSSFFSIVEDGEAVIVVELGNSVFAGGNVAQNQEVLIIPEGVTKIGASAFRYNTFKTLILPSTLVEIGEYAFADCYNLEQVVILGNIKAIPDMAFYNCTKLTSIQLPDSVESIGTYAFALTSSLKFMAMPANLKVIGARAFSESGIMSVEFSSQSVLEEIGSYAFYLSNIQKIDIPEGVHTIYNHAFYFSALKEARLPSTVRAMGAYAFASCVGLHTFVVAEGATVLGDYCVVWVDAYGIYENRVLTTLVIPESVEVFGAYAFAVVMSVGSLNLPNVWYIGDYAFGGCEGLTTVTLGSNAYYIGYGAFIQSKLTSIDMGATVIVDAYAFSDCYLLSNVIMEKVELIGNYAFQNCYSIKEVYLKETSYIYPSAFRGCTNLNKVVAPKLRAIGMGVFYNTSIAEFAISASCEIIAEGAFVGSKISTFTIHEDNEHYFVENKNIIYSYLANGGYEVVAYAPYSPETKVVVKEGTVRIGAWAFGYATNLNSITLPSTLKTIGASAFYYVGLGTDLYSTATFVFTSLNAPILEGYLSSNQSLIYQYTNFGYYLLTIINNFEVPANGEGYNSYIYDMFALDSITMGAEVISGNTQFFISKLNELTDNITLENEQDVLALRQLYNELSAAQQALVGDISKLLSAENTLAQLKAIDIEEEQPSFYQAYRAFAVVSVMLMIICVMLIMAFIVKSAKGVRKDA